MKFSVALLTSALLATSAVAAPARKGSSLAQRLASRRKTTLPILVEPSRTTEFSPAGNNSNVQYSDNWAGAVLTAPPSGQTFNAVSAQFVVPTPKVPSGGSGTYAASAWVGIDGDTYQDAILQTGVDFYASSSGGVSFDCWYEWYPNDAYDFSGISVSAGNTISLSVTSSSSSKGVATIKNLSTGQTVSKSLSAPSSSSHLSGQNAEWIVEDFEEDGSLVPLANWGTVTFTNAQYGASSSSGGTTGAQILDIEQNGKVYSSVSIPSSSEVVVSYE